MILDLIKLLKFLVVKQKTRRLSLSCRRVQLRGIRTLNKKSTASKLNLKGISRNLRFGSLRILDLFKIWNSTTFDCILPLIYCNILHVSIQVYTRWSSFKKIVDWYPCYHPNPGQFLQGLIWSATQWVNCNNCILPKGLMASRQTSNCTSCKNLHPEPRHCLCLFSDTPGWYPTTSSILQGN